jgi:CopG antitoxin of type II toxin-antitoxin system
MKKKIPEFKNEDDERRFWAKADSTEYVDWPSARRRKLVQLKPSYGQFPCGFPYP